MHHVETYLWPCVASRSRVHAPESRHIPRCEALVFLFFVKVHSGIYRVSDVPSFTGGVTQHPHLRVVLLRERATHPC
jgi:hypothetical protein